MIQIKLLSNIIIIFKVKKMENHKDKLEELLTSSKIFLENSTGKNELLISLVIRDIEKVLTTDFIPKWVVGVFENLVSKFYCL